MIGQHLRVRKDGRWIHAIDCGDETVLHLGEETPRRVRRSYRPEFVAGAETVEPVLHRERTFAPKEIVRRAYSRAADTVLAAMFADSEAFAEWCATGRLTAPRNVVAEPAPVAAAAFAAPEPAKAAPKQAAPKKAAPKKAAVKAKATARAAPKRARAKPARKAAKRAAARPARRAAKRSATKAAKRTPKAGRPARRAKKR